jgi:hypothetical protein
LSIEAVLDVLPETPGAPRFGVNALQAIRCEIVAMYQQSCLIRYQRLRRDTERQVRLSVISNEPLIGNLKVTIGSSRFAQRSRPQEPCQTGEQ